MERYRDAICVFDENAAAEWGRLMREASDKNRPLAHHDSMISAIARSFGLKGPDSELEGLSWLRDG